MNKHETGIGDQGSENLEQLLRAAAPPVGDESGTVRDLWPAMQQQLKQQDPSRAIAAVPWFDWALAGALSVMAVLFPVSVPLLLYYL